jgi:hypothetical protein
MLGLDCAGTAWRCFFPRTVVSHIASPVFALQPALDGWMFGHCSGGDSGTPTRHAPYFVHRALETRRRCDLAATAGAVWARDEEDADCEGQGQEVRLLDEAAWRQGVDKLAGGARLLLNSSGEELARAAALLDEARDLLNAAAAVSLDACKVSSSSLVDIQVR